MNKMKISKGAGMKSKVMAALVAVGMMVSVASAVDVTKFKIDGVGLGDSYDKIKKALSCQNRIFDTVSINSSELLKVKSSNVVCTKETYSAKERLTFALDNDSKVYKIDKHISFLKEPVWNDVTKDILSKYQTPNMQSESRSTTKNTYHPAFTTYFCWGTCIADDISNEFWTGERVQSATDSIGMLIKEHSMDGTNNMHITLSNWLMWKKINEYNANVRTKNQKKDSQHSQTKVTWKIKSKFDNPKSYDPEHSATVYNVSCSNGKSDVVSYFYNMQYGKYSVSGKAGMESLDEAANYICGNR